MMLVQAHVQADSPLLQLFLTIRLSLSQKMKGEN